MSRVNLSWVDLSQADLTEADLSRADLYDANLGAVTLRRADLTEADLSRAYLREANLTGANLSRATLIGADLWAAQMTGAELTGADLTLACLDRAHLYGANLDGAHLRDTDLTEADLSRANLTAAVLIGADLTRAILTETTFVSATLDSCQVYGITAWNVHLDDAIQTNLRITPDHEAEISVDNLETAQFLYFMLHNEKVREVVEIHPSKIVLMLGHFTPERQAVRDKLCDMLRQHEPPYLPVLFTVQGTSDSNAHQNGVSLARLAHFIIADVTDMASEADPANVRQTLQAIVPHVQTRVLPIIAEGARPDPLLDDWKFPWVLDVYGYADLDRLAAVARDAINGPAEASAHEPLASEQLVEESAD